MAELSLTPMSTQRALNLLTALAGKDVKKVSGKGVTALANTDVAEKLFVVNRAMFGSFAGLGPDDECSLADLRARGVKSFLLRCNQDRDVVTVKL